MSGASRIRATARCVAWVAIAVALAPRVPADEEVQFTRVHVPAGRTDDIPITGERYLPMPVADFDRAVARRGAADAPRPMLGTVAYDVAVDAAGGLTGTIDFELDAASAAFVSAVPLGRVDAWDAALRTSDGVGEAAVFGTPEGGVAVRTRAAGRYAVRFACPPLDGGCATVRLPLVPALTSTVRLRLPPDLRPVVACVPPLSAAVVDGDGDAWRITVGRAEALVVSFVPRTARQPRFRIWNHVGLAGRRADVAARIVPENVWIDGTIDLVPDAGLTLTAVGDRAVPGAGPDTALVRVELPPTLIGTRTPLDVRGIAPFDVGRGQRLPVLRAAADAWAGGGVTIVVDPPLAIESLDLEDGAVVGPDAAADWPVAAVVGNEGGPADAADERAAEVHVEDQSAAAAVVLRLSRRPAEFDVARVSTVEISPGAVVGRAACDVRVRAGEAFGITARIEPGWFIDAVEAVEWQPDPGPDAPPDAAGNARAAAVTDATRSIDWRVVRTPPLAELRVDLAEAATRSRSLGLRITGHRRGVPLGGLFLTSDMDMVRLEGESPDAALVDFRVGPEAVVEIDGSPIGILAADGRLAPLVEPGPARGRIRGGARAAAREARLVQRRPPLDADVQVQLVARDGQLAESATFTCRPDAGAIDSIVAHFSEPLGEAAEWSLLHPDGTTIVSRRLDVDAGSRSARRPDVAESWLVEFRPAVEGSVTFRVSRTLPFSAAVPVTLAWVEGATEERGTLVVRGAAGVRPTVVNRRLWELPPEPVEAGDAAGVVAEFRYAGPDSMPAGGEPPAEVVPVPAAEARAWAWRERTTAWCHESGRTEYETAYDVENRGRGELVFSVPPGTTLREIVIDGESAPFDVGRASATDIRVELPQERARCELLVRGEVVSPGGAGIRSVDPTPCTIDAPVLARELVLMVPPELEVVGPRPHDEAPPGWIERLFDAVPRSEPPRSRETTRSFGFRRVSVASAAAGAGRAVLVVRRDLLASMAILAWIFSAAVTAWAMPRRGVPVLAAGCVAAVAAIWVEPPLVAVARAAWWGVLTGAVLGMVQRPRVLAVVAALAVCGPATTARAAEPWRVFLPADDEGVVLVPERLYRTLAADDGEAAAAVRVRSCVMRVPATAEGAWLLTLEIDADRGGVLVLRQQPDCRWQPPREPPPGLTVNVSAAGTEARVVAATPGLRSLTLGITPTISRRGVVEFRSVALPPAARAEVVVPESVGGGGWQCDRSDGGDAWGPAVLRGDRFDVSHAARVRLVRSLDARHPLAGEFREAASRNDVSWTRSGCRLRATFEIEAGNATVRTVVVRASPGLRAIRSETGGAVLPLPGDRWIAEVAEPTPGRSVVAFDFELPTVEPVGVFDVPFAWLEGVENDVRTVRCLADSEFELVPELPPGLTLFRPRDAEPAVVAAWRTETLATARGDAAASAALEPRRDPGTAPDLTARLAIRRRPATFRVTQQLDVDYEPDHVGLTLEAEIDAVAAPLTAVPVELPPSAVVDAFTIRERAGEDDRPVDAFAARPTDDRLMVVVQRPRPGRFHLRLEARVPSAPDRTGPMPLARCVEPGATPLVVTWRSAADMRVDVAAGVGGDPDVREVTAGEPGPLVTVAASEADDRVGTFREPGTTATRPDDPLAAALDAVLVHVALDGRGRAWGLARFDLAPTTRDVTLRMPAGMRVFDILVDGRETRAQPRSGDAWDVSLHDIRWPRTMLVVFAGEVGGRPGRGDVIRLDPPWIEGLRSREVLWSIDSPDGMPLRVVESGETLDALQWRGRRDTARRRLAEAFDVALQNVAGPESGRLAAFARRRQQGDPSTLESSWERAFSAADESQPRLFVAARGDGGVTIRAVRMADPTAAARGLVTVVVLAALAAGWAVTTRWPNDVRVVVRAAWPWGVLIAGLAWTAWLRPTLPGWALVTVGGLAVAARLRRAAVPVLPAPVAADASTRAISPR
jgi:hypothetical protein